MRLSAALLTALALTACGPATDSRSTAAPARNLAEPGWNMTSMTFYLPYRLIEERVATAELTGYVNRLKAEAITAFAGQPAGPGVSGAVIFIAQPDGQTRVWLVTGDPELPTPVSEAILVKLKTVVGPKVENGPVVAGLLFNVWGGGAEPEGMPMPLPDGWRRLLPEGGGYFDDAFVARVWEEG
jgi:hypothetical protein